jgi:hypothetical protein
MNYNEEFYELYDLLKIEESNSSVKGYEQLKDHRKALFDKTYSILKDKHPEWNAIVVEDEEVFLKVYFDNGKFLHFFENKSWY